jgi:hypothetical protein
MRSWNTDTIDVRHDPLIAAALTQWLRSEGIRDTVSHDRIIGCPHEEGIDYPIGRSCPQCPFWASIDRFTHEPISAPVAKMSPDEVLIELANDRITHPLEALGSAEAHRGVLVQPLSTFSGRLTSRGPVRLAIVWPLTTDCPMRSDSQVCRMAALPPGARARGGGVAAPKPARGASNRSFRAAR